MTDDLDILRTILAWGFILAGGFFLIVSAIGLNRMPDVFTRLHAASVGDTLGAGLMLVGMIIVAGFTLVTVKLIFLLVFLWFIGPFATHAVARAALQAGIKPMLARNEVSAEAPAKSEDSPSKP